MCFSVCMESVKRQVQISTKQTGRQRIDHHQPQPPTHHQATRQPGMQGERQWQDQLEQAPPQVEAGAML